MMAIKLVVLTMAVLATALAIPDCTTMVGDKNFNIKSLCSKPHNIVFSSNPQGADCITTTAICNNDGTASITTKFYVNGVVNKTVRSVASDNGDGRILRTYPDSDGAPDVTQVILLFSEYEDKKIKYATVFCKKNEREPFVKMIAANYERADINDELRTMKNLYPTGANLVQLPSTSC